MSCGLGIIQVKNHLKVILLISFYLLGYKMERRDSVSNYFLLRLHNFLDNKSTWGRLVVAIGLQ